MSYASLELYLTIDDAARLEAALHTYDRYTAGAAPDRGSLAAAPLLSDWRRTLVPTVEPALAGRVGEPPLMPRSVLTSRLLLLDAEAGWARTASRLYRLGAPTR